MANGERKCVVPGCDNPVHAKGYCRKHYGQIWRKGAIYEGDGRTLCDRREDNDRVRSLQRELARAEMVYKNILGVENRTKWRREIDGIKAEMARLGVSAVPVSDEEALQEQGGTGAWQ